MCLDHLKLEAAAAVCYRDGILQSFFSAATYGGYVSPGRRGWINPYLSATLSGFNFGLIPLTVGVKGYIDRLTR